MQDKNKHDDYPDISKLFKIDENEIPDEIIKKDTSVRKTGEAILNSDEALKSLPKKTQKAIKKDKSIKKRNDFISKSKKRVIIAASVAAAAAILILVLGFFVTQSKKPVVSFEKPAVETISVHTDDIGITYSVNGSLHVVFVDNEYDTNFIEAGQTVEMTTAQSVSVTGKITEIKEEAPESDIISKHYSVLTTDLPSTSVYCVYIKPDTPDAFEIEGTVVSVKVLTKTSTDAVTVPSTAVLEDSSGTFVWTYSPFTGSISRLDVTTGISSDGRTEITSEIKKSTRVIYSFSCRAEELSEDMKVRTK
ncbi:MAG: hypothetical protein E7573_04865 [Ruminococcaceae bacterium]|nr:hypothetical protein [Oscillospiraceae bacterium]MBR3596187.1 hypothetical protein [Clostridia bacterium]